MSRQYINAVYYPNWRVYKGLPPSALQVKCITHIYYAFVGYVTAKRLPIRSYVCSRDRQAETLTANPPAPESPRAVRSRYVPVSRTTSKTECDEHVIIANATPRQLNDEWADLKIDVDGVKGCIAAVAQIKRNNPGIKTVVTFGGGEGSGPFPTLAASSRARSTFAAQARNFVDTHGFDGVDIDWEQPSNDAQGRDYLALMQALRDALPSPRYVLATALPCGQWALRHIPLEPLAPLIDYLNLMSYDFSGPWTPAAGHQAQLRPPPPPGCPQPPPPSGQAGVSYLVAHGVHPAKVALGIPAYARCFAGARGPGDAYSAASEVDYRDLPADAVDGLARVDEEAGAACYVDGGDNGKGFVSLDTPDTVRLKARYARTNRLAGLFYWQGVGDVDTPGRSLVAAGWQELRAPYSD
ncbi:hypothetical protein RB595_004921 [Gaeumannomyces hyphopodioides]